MESENAANVLTDVGCELLISPGDSVGIFRSVTLGKYKGRNVAVKVFQHGKGREKFIIKEVEVLQKLGDHPNTVNFIRSVKDQRSAVPTYYIAQELCRTSELENILNGNRSSALRRKICHHLALGLHHIHQKEVLHGNINPRYVFVSWDGKSLKIGGFGLSRSLRSESVAKSVPNRIGNWGSPEHYKRSSDAPKGKESDMFSIGLIFHYVLRDGKHDFSRDMIENASSDMPLRLHAYLTDTSRHLLKMMLQSDSEKRPSTEEILRHPFFWCENKKNDFKNKLQSSLRSSRSKLSSVFRDLGNDMKEVLMYECIVGTRTPEFKRQRERLQKDWQRLGNELRDFYLGERFQEFKRGELADDDDLIRRVESLKLPKEKVTTGQMIGSAKPITSQPNTERFNDTTVVLKPLHAKSWIFAGCTSGIFKENIVVKLIDNQEALEPYRRLKDSHLFVSLTATEVRKRAWVANQDTSFETPPEIGKEYYWLFMKEYDDATIFSLSDDMILEVELKKKCVVHILLAVKEMHQKECFGKIRPRKFLLPKGGPNYVTMLGSSMWKISSDPQHRRENIRDVSRVICALMTEVDFESLRGKDLKQIKKKVSLGLGEMADCKALFFHFIELLWSADMTKCPETLSHPFLWDSKKILDFLKQVANSSCMETMPDVRCQENWIDNLKLDNEEKAKWYSADPSGHIHKKAAAEKSKYRNHPSIQLLRLIRNKYQHLEEDLKSYEKKFNQERQTLFRRDNSDENLYHDFWRFFDKRCPTLLYDVYTTIKQMKEKPHELEGYFRWIPDLLPLKIPTANPRLD